MKQISVGAIAVVLFALSTLIISEAFAVGYSNTDYYFGSDTMIAKGGWAYRSVRSYVISSLLEGLPLATAAVLLGLYVRKPDMRFVLSALLLVTISVVAYLVRMNGTE